MTSDAVVYWQTSSMRAGQNDTTSPPIPRRRWFIVAAATLVAMVTIIPTAGATASVGSIPPDIVEFAESDEGLLTELEEYFGVDARGDGLDFSEGLELGEIDRIFLWSDAFRAGEATDTPVQYVNRWKVPVLIGEEPVGVAMIGIDPATVEPEMIDFIHSAGTALALDEVDADATLVLEPETAAWFSLNDGVIVPLVRGTSGVEAETTLSEYQTMLTGRELEIVEPDPQPDRGSVQSVVLISAAVLLLLLALLIPTIMGQVRERRERRAAAAGADTANTVDDPAVEVLESDASEANTSEAEVRDVDASAADAVTVDASVEQALVETTESPKSPAAASASTVAPPKVTKPATKVPAAKKTPATTKAPAATAKKAAPKKPVAKKPAAAKPPAATKAPAAKKPVPKKPTTSARPAE